MFCKKVKKEIETSKFHACDFEDQNILVCGQVVTIRLTLTPKVVYTKINISLN